MELIKLPWWQNKRGGRPYNRILGMIELYENWLSVHTVWKMRKCRWGREKPRGIWAEQRWERGREGRKYAEYGNVGVYIILVWQCNFSYQSDIAQMLQNYRCCSFLSRSSPNHHPPLLRDEHPPLLQTGFHQKPWINGSAL